MRVNKDIQALLDKLIAIALTSGVQPSEIADALFEDDYCEMHIIRKNGVVCMDVVFSEHAEDEVNTCTMRYLYGMDRNLMRIEQRINRGKFKVQWDRSDDTQKITKQLETLLLSINDDSEVERWLNRVPKELSGQIQKRLRLVA
ncbi:hypothetical protein J9978_06350 [Chromobacterium violaceum]|uniref:hypothetical protein n=1 Tax=Chromobacterium violaceum TaxID=536 RepID=UPI001B31DEAA|nr:hypothetical protein [Chromobacterium violaceum]MBP4049119.1 hypothetical protein [Chromobacterium violaceum]